MLFRNIYKVLVVADKIGERRPLRRHGEAIIRHLRDEHNLKVDVVHDTQDALTEIEQDASVAAVLVEWGDVGAAALGDHLEVRLERDDEVVQILTVFRSKGLQYPIVFCPFMWQSRRMP